MAKPSVHSITVDPGPPFDARATDVKRAGPRAVGPVSSIDSNFS